jgi:hypothetical protein
MPRLPTRKHSSPSINSVPSWREPKEKDDVVECGVKSREPKWISSPDVDDL